MSNDADSGLARRVAICLATMGVNFGLVLLPKWTPWYELVLAFAIVVNIIVAWRVQRGVAAFESAEHYALVVRRAKYFVIAMIAFAAIVVLLLVMADMLVKYSPIFFVFGASFSLVISRIIDASLSKRLAQQV